MLLEILGKHKDIIKEYSIEEIDHAGPHFRLKAKVSFVDGSLIQIRQIILNGKSLKYSYHWQNSSGLLIRRWDNAPHWPGVPTFPDHVHKENDVRESKIAGDLMAVLDEIHQIVAGKTE